MGFSVEWEKNYLQNQHLSIWPWTDLVSYVMRYCKNRDKNYKVLEIGCGAGANIPFFQALGVTYYAMDGSFEIVSRLQNKYPSLKDQIIVGDFTKEIPFSLEFDLIVDRAALTHNATIDIQKCILNIQPLIKKGGKYIGIDWFSTQHSDFSKGDVVDPYTKCSYMEGQFINVGKVHFSDKKHLIELFHQFEITVMEHKIITKEMPEENTVFASWNFVAENN